MKSILPLLVVIFLFISCYNHRSSVLKNERKIDNNLTIQESAIINDFLEAEVKDKRYLNYKEFEIIVIEEALKKSQSLFAYNYNYKEKKGWGRRIKKWILDSTDIKKLEIKLENEEVYHWNISDFKVLKVKLFKKIELKKLINEGNFSLDKPPYLIMYMSKPLIIDDNNAFISYEVGNGQIGFSSITHFTAQLKKIDNKWKVYQYFEDGTFY